MPALIEKKLNILIIERSPKIGSRLKDFLKDDQAVSDVHVTDSLKNAFPFFETQVDMVLLGVHLDDYSMQQLNLACSHHKTCLIVLTEYPIESLTTNYQYQQADYLFNKSVDFVKIPNIITNRVQSQSLAH